VITGVQLKRAEFGHASAWPARSYRFEDRSVRRRVDGPAAPAPWTRAADFLREDARALDAGRAAVHAAVLSDLSVSVGVAVRAEAAYVRASRAAGVPVLKRTTGGSGVLHLPGDLVWSVVLPRRDPRVGRDFARAYGRLGRGATRFLASLGLEARWAPAPGLDAGYCVLSERGEVLTVGGRILGGAAQHATGAALLHQGMIARRVERDRLDRLFGLGDPTVVARLAGLEDLGVRESGDELVAALDRALAAEFLGGPSAGPAGPSGP
jgi:lipoate-protein ligase A